MKGTLLKMVRLERGRLKRYALLVAVVAALLLTSTAPSAQARQAQAAAHPDAEVERGRRLQQSGDAKGAVAVLKPAAERLERDADAWLYLGLALVADGKPGEARKAFEKSVKLRPSSAAAHANLAFTLLHEYRSREAEREARQALKLDPALAEAHYVLGVVRYREERFEEAASSADAALRAKPGLVPAAFLKAEALLGQYFGASAKFAEKRPIKPSHTKEEREAIAEERAAALEPIKARMRETADALEALVKSQSGASVSDEVTDAIDSLRLYGSSRREGLPGILSAGELVERARILSKPEPGYTPDAREACTGGTVRLRAVLGADGKVRNIVPVKRLSHGLTESSIEAARRIKFEPARKDGRPVSQFVLLEYNFNCR